jgi:hypothetical protein
MTARQAEIDISLQVRKKEEKKHIFYKKKNSFFSDFLDFFNVFIDRQCLSISFFFL